MTTVVVAKRIGAGRMGVKEDGREANACGQDRLYM